MSRSELEKALQRPLDHNESSPEQRWQTDRGLGILDWDPTPEERAEYIRRRAAMGDKSCVERYAASGGATMPVAPRKSRMAQAIDGWIRQLEAAVEEQDWELAHSLLDEMKAYEFIE